MRIGNPILWVVFCTLAFVWGSSFLFIKLGLEEGLAPLTLVTYRLLIGTAFLFAVMRLTGARLPSDRGVLIRIGAVGILNIALPFSLITWGELWIDSALASILNGLVPLFTIVMASVYLRDEPITVNRLVGLVMGFGGAVLLLTRGLAGEGAADPGMQFIGQLAVVMASLCYAIAIVVMRGLFTGRPLVNDPVAGPRALNPVELALPQVVTAALIVGALAILVEVLGQGRSPLLPTFLAAFSVSWLGLLGSGLAYLLAFTLLNAWGATRTTLVTYAMPIVGLVLGVLVLGEVIDLQVIAGSALIIGGIVLANSRFGARRLYGRPGAQPSGTAAPAEPLP
ncbi:MAG: DMT family transporter [Candidatus Limnocylindria bacterium]